MLTLRRQQGDQHGLDLVAATRGTLRLEAQAVALHDGPGDRDLAEVLGHQPADAVHVLVLDVEADDLVEVDLFPGPTDFRTYFRDNYGPTLMAYRGLADQPGRTAELDTALDALAAAADEGSGRMRWEYVVVSGRRS